MPRTDITPFVVKTDKTAFAAQSHTPTAADVANMNAIPHTGKEMIIARNSGASPYTVTILSVPDQDFGRTGDITAASLAAGETKIFGPFPVEGWRQADNRLYIAGSNASVLFTVLRLP